MKDIAWTVPTFSLFFLGIRELVKSELVELNSLTDELVEQTNLSNYELVEQLKELVEKGVAGWDRRGQNMLGGVGWVRLGKLGYVTLA